MEGTIRVDIINKKAINILKDLEGLQLIRLHQDKETPLAPNGWSEKYKRAMYQQSLSEVDEQLRHLRSAWK